MIQTTATFCVLIICVSTYNHIFCVKPWSVKFYLTEQWINVSMYIAEDRLFTFCRYICYLFCYYPGYYWLLWKTSVCFVLTGGTGATLDNAIKRRIKSVSQMGWFLCLLHSRPTRESLCLYEVGRRKFLSKILQIKKMSSHQTEISNWNHLLNVKHFLLCLTLYIS